MSFYTELWSNLCCARQESHSLTGYPGMAGERLAFPAGLPCYPCGKAPAQGFRLWCSSWSCPLEVRAVRCEVAFMTALKSGIYRLRPWLFLKLLLAIDLGSPLLCSFHFNIYIHHFLFLSCRTDEDLRRLYRWHCCFSDLEGKCLHHYF